jgi:hypothetical protein
MNRCATILALAVAAGLLPTAARADALDQRLFDEMPTIIKKLEKEGIKAGSNVGVLRFRVQRGSDRPSFKLPLCGSMASRIENLFVMGDPKHLARDEKEALGVIHDAGAVATRHKVASWYSKPDARKKLFELTYPLAWGEEKVKPDVFLTGLLKTTPDMKTTTVTIQYFTPKSTKLEELTTFTFKSDRDIAREFGYSFAIPSKARAQLVTRRSAKGEDVDDLTFEDLPKQDQQDKKDDKDPETEKKQDPDRKPERKPAGKKPKQDTTAKPDSVGGVQVLMLVNDKAVPIRQTTDGDPIMWQVTSPAPGKTVSFRLRNNSARQLGVVLRLNGASTFDEQRDTPEKCQKWMINSGKSNLIEGFYRLIGDGEGRKKVQILPIKVLVGEDAKRARDVYLDKAGLIEVDVFEEGNEEQRLTVSARGLPPSREQKMRESYVSLRDSMIKSAGLKRSMVNRREILVPDDTSTKTTDVEEVPFKNPLLVAHITIKVVPAGPATPDEDDLPVDD